MEHTCFIPGQDTFDKIAEGEVRAFLLIGEVEDLPSVLRLKPWEESFTEDDIRRLVRRDLVPMRVQIRGQEVTSIFGLSTSKLKALGVSDRLSCLEDVQEVHPDANMSEPFTFVSFELIK